MNRRAGVGSRMGVVVLAACGAMVAAPTAQQTHRPGRPAYDDGAVEALPVQGTVHLVAGSGANVTVQIDPEGVLLVDTSVPEMSDKVLAAVRSISPLPIRHIINTSAIEHHMGGNEVLSAAGRNLNAGVGGPTGREPSRLDGAPIIAHEHALHRLSGLKQEPPRMPYASWPHDTFYTTKKQIYFGGEVVEMVHQPAAITDGDLFVWFRRSDVIAAGDLFSTVTFPRVDLARGGSVQGTLDALNTILDIAVPEINNQGGTLVVPGHGRIGNESDVAEYRDMLTIVRDRVRSMIDKGMTLQQVQAVGPARDYAPLYSAPDWTAEQFVDTVFADLSRPRARSSASRRGPGAGLQGRRGSRSGVAMALERGDCVPRSTDRITLAWPRRGCRRRASRPRRPSTCRSSSRAWI